MTDLPVSDDRAGWEHIWRSDDIPPRYRTLADPAAHVVEWAATLPAGGLLLDIGCGVGRHVVYLGGRGFRMAGIDVSPTGIKVSEEVCAERGIPFEGHVASMTSLPWADQTFDGVFATSTIHHLRRADLGRALAECWRVLKPGATLLADFPSTDTDDYQAQRARVAAGELTEVEPHTFVDERPEANPLDDEFLPHHYSDEADLRDLLQPFDIVRLDANIHEKLIGGVRVRGGRWVVWARRPLAS